MYLDSFCLDHYKTIWKHQLQLPSARKLLEEYSDNIDIFNLPEIDGIEQLAFGMKKIVENLHGEIVELGIDATCKFWPL